jgi:hypothetical protein
MMGDEASARKWFEDFLNLRKDADPLLKSIGKVRQSMPSSENELQ